MTISKVRPDAPAFDKKVATITTSSPKGESTLTTSLTGYLVGPTEFLFSPAVKNNLPERIASGSTTISFVIRDSRDSSKTIEANFPAITVGSDVARILNGCRK